MSYEQEKHKLFKTFQKSELQKQNINKLENQSPILPAHGSLNSAKQLISSLSDTVTPTYIGRPASPVILFPENGMTYGRSYPQGFEADYESVHIRFSGNGANTDRKTIGDLNVDRYNFPFVPEEVAAMEYGCTYSVQMRGWNGYFWSDWSPVTTFNTFPYVAPPALRTTGLYLFRLGGRAQEPSSRTWTYDNVYNIYNPNALISDGVGVPPANNGLSALIFSIPAYRFYYDYQTENWIEDLSDGEISIHFGKYSYLLPGGYVTLSFSGGQLYCELYRGDINLYMHGLAHFGAPYPPDDTIRDDRNTIYGGDARAEPDGVSGYRIFASSLDVIVPQPSHPAPPILPPDDVIPAVPNCFAVARAETELLNVSITSDYPTDDFYFYL